MINNNTPSMVNWRGIERQTDENEQAITDYIAQKQKEKEQKKQVNEKIKEAILNKVLGGQMKPKEGVQFDPYSNTPVNIDNFEQIPDRGTFNERLQARNILGMTPEQMAESEDYAGYVKGTKGFYDKEGNFKPGWGIGSKMKYEYTPGYEGLRQEAKALLGEAPESNSIENTEEGLPNPEKFEEGTEVELDGVIYQIINGQWQSKS